MAKKSKYDLIDEEMLNYQIFNKTSYVPTDELYKIFESNLDVPNHATLKARYVSQRISAYIGRKKNIDGTRKMLSTGTGGFTTIESERDVTNLDGVLNQLNKRVDGLTKNIRKTERQKFIAENQVSFDDLVEIK